MAAHVTARISTERICRTCGASYADAEWVALTISERIEAKDVRRLVQDWPEALCIEVRCCHRCGRGIASKRNILEA